MDTEISHEAFQSALLRHGYSAEKFGDHLSIEKQNSGSRVTRYLLTTGAFLLIGVYLILVGRVVYGIGMLALAIPAFRRMQDARNIEETSNESLLIYPGKIEIDRVSGDSAGLPVQSFKEIICEYEHLREVCVGYLLHHRDETETRILEFIASDHELVIEDVELVCNYIREYIQRAADKI